MTDTSRRMTNLLIAAAAIALTAAMATPVLAQGSASDWRYEQYLAKEAERHKSAGKADRADRQKAAVGAAEYDGARFDYPSGRNGAQRFHLDVPRWKEDQYRGR